MEFGDDKSDWLLSLQEGETSDTAERSRSDVPKNAPTPTTRPATATIPELEHSKTAVLNTVASRHSRRSYQYAIDHFYRLVLQ
jgi:hypothetical protein